jgi:hypothetical protein
VVQARGGGLRGGVFEWARDWGCRVDFGGRGQFWKVFRMRGLVTAVRPMKHNKRRVCRHRSVPMFSMEEIKRKLQGLRDAGADLDSIPLDWAISQLMEMPVPEGVVGHE